MTGTKVSKQEFSGQPDQLQTDQFPAVVKSLSMIEADVAAAEVMPTHKALLIRCDTFRSREGSAREMPMNDEALETSQRF
ncbi:hypothetical protein RRF57_011945 [Xylaria bambusicola]|uniref:Uncharacterized protein n=1 Tax=Xylaria bambusicola TaxID=326684 RepID=A0AAN7ZEH0_9PEZI